MFARILWLVGLTIAGAALWSGLPYYVTPVPERPFSPLHELYASTGLVGQGYGIVGSLLIVLGVTLYTVRKRIRALARVGKLRDWLHFHIFLCLLGPFLVLLHTTFRFGGIVAISFWSMALVVGSGVFGRYVYVWIPKTISGRFVGAQEMRERMHDLLREVQRRTDLSVERLEGIVRPAARRARADRVAPPAAARSQRASELRGPAASIDALFQGGGTASPAAAETAQATAAPGSRGALHRTERRGRDRPPGLPRAAAEALAFRLRERRTRARFDRELAAAGVVEPNRSEIVRHLVEQGRIEQQLRILHPFQRAFRYWHAFHLPLAFVMFAVLAVHVAVALAFGYTWIFGS